MFSIRWVRSSLIEYLIAAKLQMFSKLLISMEPAEGIEPPTL